MHGAPIFVRFSSRSPKDAVIKTPEFKQILKGYLGNEQNETLAVVKTLSEALKIKAGKEAFELFANSERTYGDLTRTLLYLDEKLKKQKAQMN